MPAHVQSSNAARHSACRLFRSPLCACGQRVRTGLTLIELLLVLVIMVLSVSLVVPRLFRSEQRRTLTSAADQLTGALVSTRHQSIVEGQQFFLLYQQGTPFYAVVPEPLDDTTRGQFDQVTTTLSQIASTYDPASPVAIALDGTTGIRKLPPGTRFFSGDAGVAGRNDNTAIAAEISGLPYIAFAPDGTTDDAVLELVNADSDRMAVQLRGLTGTAQIGELVPADSVGRVTQP